MARRGAFRFAGAAGVLAGLSACAPGTSTPAVNATFAPPAVTVQMLVGSTPAVLNADFGPPVLRRIDGNAQVWLYHSDVCGLDVILYPDSAGVPRVAAAAPDHGDPAGCMASLQRGATDAALEPPASS